MDEKRADKILAWLVEHPINGYACNARIGFGGSGAVYRATDASGNVRALKVYDTRFAERKRLDRELELIGHDCPHLVRIYAGGDFTCDDEPLLFLVMELVDGPNAVTLRESPTPMPDGDIRAFLRELHAAATYLARRTLCHRDIKLENIHMRATGGVVLLDFGVVRPFGPSDVTDHDRLLASRRYAPQELQHGKAGESEDALNAITAYQIGGVLYELIQGARLFHGTRDEPPADLVVAINDETPRVYRGDVGEDLLDLTRRCLSKTPSSRPSLAEIGKVASAPAFVAAAAPTLDAQIRAFAAGASEIDLLRAHAQRVIRRQHEMRGAASVVVSETLTLDGKLKSAAPVHVGPGPENDLLIALQCLTDPSAPIPLITSLRIATYLRVVPPGEVVELRGIGFDAQSIATPVEFTTALITENKVEAYLEPIWIGVYDPSSLRVACTAWVTQMVERYVAASRPRYEEYLADEKEKAEAIIAGRRPPNRSSRVPQRTVAFNTKTEATLRTTMAGLR